MRYDGKVALVTGGTHPIDDFTVEEFRALLDLNLVSVFAACKAALPHRRKPPLRLG